MSNLEFFLLSMGTVCLLSLIMLSGLLFSIHLTKGNKKDKSNG